MRKWFATATVVLGITALLVAPAQAGGDDSIRWIFDCNVAAIAKDDPIVFYGKPGASHLHSFAGNSGINALSSPTQMAGGATTCGVSANSSAYWIPTLLTSTGQPVTPEKFRIYYRGGTGSNIQPMPFGMRMIAGDPTAINEQQITMGWRCRSTSGDSILSDNSTVTNCDSGSYMQGYIAFPSCWDGVNLDSADHRSHVSYGECGGQFPVAIPEVLVEFNYSPGATSTGMQFDGGASPHALHADYLMAWDPAAMNQLTRACLSTATNCDLISDKQLPNGVSSSDFNTQAIPNIGPPLGAAIKQPPPPRAAPTSKVSPVLSSSDRVVAPWTVRTTS